MKVKDRVEEWMEKKLDNEKEIGWLIMRNDEGWIEENKLRIRKDRTYFGRKYMSLLFHGPSRFY